MSTPQRFPPVAELVPQRPPMLLVDEVLDAGDDAITCAALVRPDNLFVADGRAHASVALEYMAQAIAALAGLRARADGQPPAIGMIAACRDLELFVEHLCPGDLLHITATRVFSGAMAEYRAGVTRRGEPIAAAVLHVVGAPPTPTRSLE
jgi:predicted hotdog family 3-hydroxylacyl-ACP dehydratase